MTSRVGMSKKGGDVTPAIAVYNCSQYTDTLGLAGSRRDRLQSRVELEEEEEVRVIPSSLPFNQSKLDVAAWCVYDRLRILGQGVLYLARCAVITLCFTVRVGGRYPQEGSNGPEAFYVAHTDEYTGAAFPEILRGHKFLFEEAFSEAALSHSKYVL